MYNLKIEADKIVALLNQRGYESLLVGNYPFTKFHNSVNIENKLKPKALEIITTATLDELIEISKDSYITITAIDNTGYMKKAKIQIVVKQNIVTFTVYYSSKYTSVVSGDVFEAKTLNDILCSFSFLHSTVCLDENNKIINYVNGKLNACDAIKNRAIISNGNFKDKILTNPLMILELCCHASNISYSISASYIKLINNNYNLLEYETLDNITKTLNMILMSKRPLVGLQLIKDSLINFNYKGVPLFKFLEKISSDHLIKLNTFKSEIDLITRWAYILKALNETDRLEVINNFNLSFKNKVIWLLNNFELIFEDDYKMAIYNARDTLKIITENKFDVFLMYEMFSRLTKLHSALDEDLKDKCKLINDTICCRPFFKYQLMYDDADIKEISQCNLNDHEFENRKETLLKTIIKYNMHPTEEQYKNDIITVFN